MMKRNVLGTSVAILVGWAGVAHAEGQQTQSEQKQQQTQYGQEQQADAPGVEQAEVQQQGAERASLHGISEARVKQLQENLKDHGLYDGNIDGIAGPMTRAALQRFQQLQGLEATGTWNENTANALGMAYGIQESERQPVRGVEPTERAGSLQPGAQARLGAAEDLRLSELSKENVKQVQQQLQEHGYYQGDIDGIVGPKTRGALQGYFQHQAELAAQGMLSDTAIASFGIAESEIQRVRGEEQQGATPSRQYPSVEEQPQRAPEQQLPAQPEPETGGPETDAPAY